MYKDKKIERYELIGSAKEVTIVENDFDIIDNYKNSISDYVYTDIKITDYTEPIEKAFQSRLQQVLSEVLLRSLMLKDGLVFALNDQNFPTYYATLKSFLEIPAVLGYVADKIYKSSDYKEIISLINTVHLGNRDAGSYPVGTVKAINILTMFKSLDKIVKEIGCAGKTDDEKIKIMQAEDVLTSVYSDVCNFGHANFNSNLSIGILGKDGVWKAKTDATGYKNELWAFYMTGFIIGIKTIQMLCHRITRNSKVNNFKLLSSQKYFV